MIPLALTALGIILWAFVGVWVALAVVVPLVVLTEKKRKKKKGAVSTWTWYTTWLHPAYTLQSLRMLKEIRKKKFLAKKFELKAGDLALDADFVSVDGKVKGSLFDRIKPGRLMVVNFGSCS